MSARTKIDRKGEALIAALLTEPTQAAAAAKAGVSEATVQRWLKDPAFMVQYRLARRAIVETAIGRMQEATGEAVDVLRRNMSCGNPAVEVRAAALILEQARSGVELLDLMTTIEALAEVCGSAPTDSNPSSWSVMDQADCEPSHAVNVYETPVSPDDAEVS